MLPSIANSQSHWNRLPFDPGKDIGCGYFFDEDHGMVGSGVRPSTYFLRNGASSILMAYRGDSISIYKTSDGGSNWRPCIVPPATGAVTQIVMQDALVGYASIFSDASYDISFNFGNNGLWKTTDGGDSWFNLQLDHLATCVYAQDGLLMYTQWDKSYTTQDLAPFDDTSGGAVSFDGQSWFKGFRRGNGIDFSDSLSGVVAEMNGPGQNFWYTTDAGRTWLASTDQLESWSVHAVKGERIYLCANEAQTAYAHTRINISYDGGATWQVITNFPEMHFTGTIEGVGNTVYFQTDSTYYGQNYLRGLYRSDDLGVTWHWVGGPSHSRDTRFVVTGCLGQVVYAFDGYGGVWKTTDGGDGTLGGEFAVSMDSLRWHAEACGDTLRFDIFGTNCETITIDSVSVLGDQEFIHLEFDSVLPRDLNANDTALHVALAYSPTRQGPSSSVIRTYGHHGLHTFTQDIPVNLDNKRSSSLLLWRDTSKLQVDECNAVLDTIYLNNLSCPGMTLDSVVLDSGVVSIISALPVPVSDYIRTPLIFFYQPDRVGRHELTAKVYTHSGRRRIDTTIHIIAEATQVHSLFTLDSTHLDFTTSYCHPQSRTLRLRISGCDTIAIDSIHFDSPFFSMMYGAKSIDPSGSDSLTVMYIPDSIPLKTGTAHIYAHGKRATLDTIIDLVGRNIRPPEGVGLSSVALSLATRRCTAVTDSFLITNQGCVDAVIDSLKLDGAEVALSEDYVGRTITNEDSLRIEIFYTPADGANKIVQLRMWMHTASRNIDTTIALNLSNTIPPNPLSLSTDSVYFFTKYCQPVTLPITLSNNACQSITFDSVAIEQDVRHEFSADKFPLTVGPQNVTTTTVTFTPDTSGERIARMRLYGHFGDQRADTVIRLVGKNLTAPEPYLGPIASSNGGAHILIPLMLRATTDTFSIQSYAGHLTFNTDILKATTLGFGETTSLDVMDYHVNYEPGTGASFSATLQHPITDTNGFVKPLCYIVADVYLSRDSVTQIVLDKFSTDRQPSFALCNIPSQPFDVLLTCGDGMRRELINTGRVHFEVISVAPNPVSSENGWDLVYNVSGDQSLTIELYDAKGNQVYRADAVSSRGKHEAIIPTPSVNGDYFLALVSPEGRRVRKVSVAR